MKLTTYYLYNRIKDKKVVLVDYFDTVVFRSVHSWEMYPQWAKMLIWRLNLEGRYSIEELVAIRNKAINTLRKDYEEPPYREVIGLMFDMLHPNVSKDVFFHLNYDIDVNIELGVQYPNPTIVSLLKKAKRQGKKLYLVSDFYMPESAYSLFLKNTGVKDLFDGIFVSEKWNKSKRQGTLYTEVLQQTYSRPEDCVMIGDQKADDKLHAEEKGIEGFRYFPVFHKIKTNLHRKLRKDFFKEIVPKMGKRLRKNSMFVEYAIPLYLYERRLLAKVKEEQVKRLAFFLGGYFLQKLFNILIDFTGYSQIDSKYCYISRKVVYAAKEDGGEDRQILLEYLKDFMAGDTLNFVDEGWYCHSQQILTESFGIKTRGYYLGVRGRDTIQRAADCNRKGLLFDIDNINDSSTYYGAFCTNCSLYEQMLTSPEGSVKSYERRNGKIEPILKENPQEKDIYLKYTKDWQDKMILSFRGFLGWTANQELDVKQFAKVMLQTDLWNNDDRCRFLNDMDAAMIDNMGAGQKQIAKTIKDVHVNIFDIFVHPANYLNQICKLQRHIYCKKPLNIVYKACARLYYLYTRMLMK